MRMPVYAIGIDIGGTKTAGALVDLEGNLLYKQQVSTPASDPKALEDNVVEIITYLAEKSDQSIVGVGVAAAGFIDAEQAVVYYAPNIAWRNEPLKQKLQDRTGYRVAIENDANAAGWAEFRFGVGRHVDSMVMVTIGTGVGGAIIHDGTLFRGGFGVGSEIGHMRVVPDGLLCGCGSFGCIEQYGSGRALQRYALEIAKTPAGAALARAYDHESGTIPSRVFKKFLDEKDPGALSALEQVGSWLGQACASYSAILDPELFVFGGGVSRTGESFLEPIRTAYRKHLAASQSRPIASFEIATLVESAGLIGAADLVRVSLVNQA